MHVLIRSFIRTGRVVGRQGGAGPVTSFVIIGNATIWTPKPNFYAS